MKNTRKFFGLMLILSLVGLVIRTPGDLTRTAEQMGQRSPSGVTLLAADNNQTDDDLGPWVSEPVEPVLTLAARDLPYREVLPTVEREINPRMTFGPVPDTDFDPPSKADPLLAVQKAAPPAQVDAFDTPIFNFNGQGYTFLNPPDTVGAVGKDHYIQMINSTWVAIYDKTTGTPTIAPFDLSDLGGCATDNGDPIVLYDQLADRWFLSEFGPGTSLCTYISQTPDPTGAYYSYQFNTLNFPDYPKYGVWPDAYYATTNENSPAVYALNRAAMLAGTAATAQRFTAPPLAGFSFQALTPADLDGMTPPPAGAPNYMMRHVDTEAHSVIGFPTNDILEVWSFTVDWVTPANSSFTKIADVLTAEFDSTLCGLSSFFCMGMPGVPQGNASSLDPLREVIMHRLAYRNFGTHQVLVGNFVTDIGSNFGGIRWFELRKVGAGAWSLYQEGTYAPTTSDNRWMGGIAMDGSGNIALGYNVSSQSIYPSIRYAGRLASDPPGTLPQGEYTLVNGSAVNGSNRYGDYSAMSIDPIDDCTFWFTGEYNAAAQWSTRIGAFRFDTCGSSGTAGISLEQTVGLSAAPLPVTTEITVTSGSEVFFHYRVENTGTVSLTLHTLTSDQFGVVIGPDLNYLLDIGQVLTGSISATVSAPLVNTFTWVASDGGVFSAEDSAAASVHVVNPAVALTKTVGTDAGVCAATDTVAVDAGAAVYYCYTVENTGGTALPLHDLVDDQLGVIFSDLAYDLLPGESVDTVTAGLTISEVLTTTTTNTATWTAKDGDQISVSASDTATVTVNLPPTYGVEVTPAEAALSGAPGETVMYALQVTNTGDITNTFAITYTGNTWDVHLVDTSVELGAGESGEVMVHVMIPADTADGDSDAVTVEVSGEGGAMDTSSLTTTAVIGESKVFLPVIPQDFDVP